MAYIQSKKAIYIWIIGTLLFVVVLYSFFAGDGVEITGNIIYEAGCRNVTEYSLESRSGAFEVQVKDCDVRDDCNCTKRSWLGKCKRCKCAGIYEAKIPHEVEKCIWD